MEVKRINSSDANVSKYVFDFDNAVAEAVLYKYPTYEERTVICYSTRCFDPAGQDDIGGGCGQLWFVQDWMRKHPTLARPSIGRGIAVVHAPRVLREA